MAKKILKKPSGFQDNFVRKPGNDPQVTHYCPGCGHGRIHKLVAEAMEELGIQEKTIFVSPVGCSVFGYYYFNCGNIQAAHGRAPAVATGAARSNPGAITISYQGDGDLAAIGTAEIIHAANRGENLTVIFVNNQIYGMTGGQMAPTSMSGQITSTSPYGRDVSDLGHPIRMSEIIASLEAPVYVERVAVTDSKSIMQAKKAINRALKSQKDGFGFSFVEILSACPIGWKMKPKDAIKRIKEEIIPYFPVKNFKDEIEKRSPRVIKKLDPQANKILEVLDVDKESTLFKINKSFVGNFLRQKVRIAGFGGQGVLMAGTTLGQLGMELGLNVTWLPSYGPEMRGGTANCHVVLDRQEIGSPVVERPNVLIAMNGPSLDEFEKCVEPNGTIFVNSSLISRKVKRTDVKAIYVPMTEIAESLGIIAASNMVALTTYLAYSKVISIDDLKTTIKAGFKKKALIDINLQVVDKAVEYVEKHC